MKDEQHNLTFTDIQDVKGPDRQNWVKPRLQFLSLKEALNTTRNVTANDGSSGYS
jgi:hypothetical protein